MTARTPARPVAVFAHNEAHNILACLDSLQRAAEHPPECYVIANGCRDRTEALVRDYARRHRGIHLVSIELGDKANAWNTFVHHIAPPGRPCYFFTDGDVRATPGSLDALARALERHPGANGASALPCSGRGCEDFRRDMLAHHGVAGNLYGVRGDFLERVRARGISMPVGTVGEDALIGAMLKWDLSGETRWDDAKVAVAVDAGFEFDPVSPWRLREWRKYFRRRVRYSIRDYQNRMFGRAIQPAGFESLPPQVGEMYARHAEMLTLKWRGGDTLFDWLAIREIRAALTRECAH